MVIIMVSKLGLENLEDVYYPTLAYIQDLSDASERYVDPDLEGLD